MLKVGRLLARDSAFTPIFERLEAELDQANQTEEKLSDARQRAKRLLDRRSNGDRGEKAGCVLQ